MIKEINTKDLINSELLVKEPVNELYKKINNTESSKIILTGGRGVGKSVILMNKEKNDIVGENKSIFMQLDGYCVLGKNSFDKKFFTHYYETIFSDLILHYIKKNYELTYKKYFKEMHDNLRKITRDTCDYINKCEYIDSDFNNHLILGDYSYQVLNKLKNVLDINSFTLMLDRYDWMNSDEQEHFSNYFGMFDKVVVSSSDSDLGKEKRDLLFEDEYEFVDVDYGTNPEVVKEILSRRIMLHNETIDLGKEKKFPLEIITDEMYEYLSKNCDGNIKVMIDVMRYFIDEYDFKKEKTFNPLEILKKISYERMEYYYKIHDMTTCLHLVKK